MLRKARREFDYVLVHDDDRIGQATVAELADTVVITGFVTGLPTAEAIPPQRMTTRERLHASLNRAYHRAAGEKARSATELRSAVLAEREKHGAWSWGPEWDEAVETWEVPTDTPRRG